MINVNENFFKLKDSYLFVTIARKVSEFQAANPDKKVIKLGIGDVTRPLPPSITSAMKKAVDEMGSAETFRGYGPEIGYDFLREKVANFDYVKRGIPLTKDEVFISDGIAPDIGNFGDLLDLNNTVAIADPVYPEYLDVSIMSGRENIVYIPFTAENNFNPDPPKEKVDMIYLCMPNNPTGTALKRNELKKWVDYAIENKALILFDAAYERFVQDDDVPHSIYEIEGAKKVAIEFKSFSKTAGFTGIRCAYTVVPNEAVAYTKEGKEVRLNPLWNRRQSTKFNGVSYITQRGAEAVYTEEGQEEIKKNIEYYTNNVKIIKGGLQEAGFTVFGGECSPYVWLKVPSGMTSWEFFDLLLEKANVVGTPGVGFGPSGEGYFRLTGFGTEENTKEAVERIKKVF